ncbi:MAG: lysylphosphatidylglycerol synthase transmembrane domain-containing protein [Candidatus Altiarchaeota archaeon]|nr:lysylphosphatidylglycerol synthase transmembrane domain-containing protein [Candidatus Altiarchaeota archaeon]
MKTRDVLPFVIGFILLAVLFYTLGPAKIAGLLLKTNLWYFVPALLVYFFCDLLSALTLKVLFPEAKLSMLLPCHMCGMLYSAITPGRVGYFYVAYSLSKSLGRSASANAGLLTLMQAINFFLKVVFSLAAVVYFSLYLLSVEAKYYLVMVSLAPLSAVALIGVFLYTDIPIKLIGARGGILGKVKEYTVAMQEAGKSVGRKAILKMMMLSICGWLLLGVMSYLIVRSLGLEAGFIACLMMHPLLSAIMFVPFVPAGLGLTETGSAVIFNIIGLSTADGVAFMLLLRAAMIFVDAFGVIDMKLAGGK